MRTVFYDPEPSSLKGTVHSRIKIGIIASSKLMHTCFFFLLQNTKRKILKNRLTVIVHTVKVSGGQMSFLDPIDFYCMDKKLKQNIFLIFFVQCSK